MGAENTQLLHLELRCDRDAPGVVREALDRALGDSQLRESARLVASELVTNAVQHSGAGPDELIEVSAMFDSGSLVISVVDPCIAGSPARVRNDGWSAAGGFGLRIVENIARSWGAERPGGQRVWAELAS